ncbi:MAG: hypothetical protein ABJO01_04415 [Parasphingorhabdus sp.]|uniref:hypothetical protein n=1 Tax=Parasphingorhabdus sp. TaxID=2709688 RepID=UPI0032986142
MRISKIFWGLGASAVAMSMASTSVLAQASPSTEQSASMATDDELSEEEKAQIGVIIGGGALAAAGTKLHSDPKPKMRKISKAEMERFGKTLQPNAAQSRPTSLKQLKQRGEAARATRANRIAGSADDMAKLERRGNAAKGARQVKAAPRARPVNITNSNLGRMIEKGENAQRARVNRVAGSADDLTELNRRGNAAKNARLNRTAPTRKGSGMKVTFRDQVRAKPAQSKFSTRGADSFGRKLTNPKGANADIARLVSKGDAAQAARGRMVNEGQVVRNIANKGGDISKLNKAGRSAQVARGAGGLKAASKATDAAKMAKTAKLAKTAKVGATAAKIGKGGRAALAGTGVGAVVIAAEIAGKESVKALTGAEVQDPISTGFQYGAAIFDKDVSLRDVAAQRRAHHRENFRKIGQTFTTKGKLKENLSAYGQEKGTQIRKTAVKVDRFDRNVRAGIKDKTGLTLERQSDVRKRYGAAATSDKPVKAVAKVATDRAKHHINNAKAVSKKTKCGLGNLFRSKKNDKKC